eukprot:COSAG01_NODE_1314_length_10760_cov_3.305131_2_plen_74_part_00
MTAGGCWRPAGVALVAAGCLLLPWLAAVASAAAPPAGCMGTGWQPLLLAVAPRSPAVWCRATTAPAMVVQRGS